MRDIAYGCFQSITIFIFYPIVAHLMRSGKVTGVKSLGSYVIGTIFFFKCQVNDVVLCSVSASPHFNGDALPCSVH